MHFVVRVRPFTIREAAQMYVLLDPAHLYLYRLTLYRTKTDDGTLFLGEGSLAGAPTPKLGGKGIRPVIKVVDDRCL